MPPDNQNQNPPAPQGQPDNGIPPAIPQTPVNSAAPEAMDIPSYAKTTRPYYAQTSEQKPTGKKKMGLETYAGDMVEAVRYGEGSVIKIAMAENKRREQEEQAVSPTSRKNMILISVSALCIVIGLIVAYSAFRSKPRTIPVEAPAVETQALIYADQGKEIGVDGKGRDALSDAIAAEVKSTSLAPTSILNVYLTKGISTIKTAINAQEFFALLKLNMPQSLSISLTPAFMVGAYGNAEGNTPFLLITTDSKDNAFAGMLLWERKMFYDLFPLFSIPISDENDPLFQANFTDTIIENRDARALKDEAGNIVLFWTFVNPTTIIITGDHAAMAEVFSRLRTKNIELTK